MTSLRGAEPARYGRRGGDPQIDAEPPKACLSEIAREIAARLPAIADRPRDRPVRP